MKGNWYRVIWMSFLFAVGIYLGCLLHERFDKIEGRIEAVEERIQFYDLQITRNESTSSMTLENGAYHHGIICIPTDATLGDCSFPYDIIYSSTEPLTIELIPRN